MAETINIPRDSTVKEIAEALNTIASSMVMSDGSISSWYDVQRIVQQGAGKNVFPVGTQLRCNHSRFGDIVWDVVAHDNNLSPTAGLDAHSMTLLTHNPIIKCYFDSPEVLCYIAEDSELEGGKTYNFELPIGYRDGTTSPIEKNDNTDAGGGKTYYFTIENSLSAGNVIVLDWKNKIVSGTTNVSIYDSILSTNVIENCIIYEGDDGEALGMAGGGGVVVMNNPQRTTGSDNWKQSNIRQYLNSNDEMGNWWSAQTKFDRPPTIASTHNGFIFDLDSNFVNVVGEIDNITATNEVYETNTIGESKTDDLNSFYITRDKFWIPSITEIHGIKNNNVAEGRLFDYFSESNSSKIKYNSTGAPTFWYTRSAVSKYCSKLYRITSSGGYYSSLCFGAEIAPVACVIY